MTCLIVHVLQVAAGAFYEAQQMYKTVYHRYKSRKQLQDSYLVLKSGAEQQLASNQINCGMELANMLLDAYTANQEPANQEMLGSIQAILQALPQPLQLADPDSTSELEETSRFVMAALKWANKHGAVAAVQQLHDTYAAWIYAAFGWRQFSKAALHYSRGADAAAYAAALAAVSSQTGGQEADLFVTRAVLQTLACAHAATKDRQLKHAADLLDACKQQQPSLADAPLIHFCQLLLQALALRKPSLVTLLQDRYQPSLDVDPSFEAFLSSVEQTYFNIMPSGGAGGGLLGGLLKSLLEGDEMGGE
jgi:hypothetical protein